MTDMPHTCVEIVYFPSSMYVTDYLNISKTNFEDEKELSIIYCKSAELSFCTYKFLKL